MTQFTSRRSIRRYTQQPIDEALLHRLLSDAERTQTMGNLQLYSVVVTRSDEMKARLAPAHFSQPMVTGAPVVLTFCADYRRTTLWAEQRQGHPGYDNLLSFINAATDALLYCQTFTDYTPERIDAAYAEKEATEENRHFVEINNVQTLAQIFTDIRYTRKDNEAMSATLIKALRRQGFLK